MALFECSSSYILVFVFIFSTPQRKPEQRGWAQRARLPEARGSNRPGAPEHYCNFGSGKSYSEFLCFHNIHVLKYVMSRRL